jgi:hypothetical protein
MSYGHQIGYPNGLKMQNGYQVDSGFILTPGTYTISEEVPSGFQLTIDIVDPSGGSSSSGSQATIKLAAGETVIVTYINTKSNITPTPQTYTPTYTPSPPPTSNLGRIIVKKQTNPSGVADSFPFAPSYGLQSGYPNGFSLRDGQQIDSGFTITPGTYTITEAIPASWQVRIDISDPTGNSSSSGNKATIDLAAGETVTVTYINTKIG